MRDYEAVRRGEGRGAPDSAYYRALPFQDLSGRFAGAWEIRAASFRALEARLGPPGLALDVGSGCGWLAYRLAQRGYRTAAVDLQTNGEDGLGAYAHYDAEFVPVQAEFDRLPFGAGVVDLLVFNASLHYSTDYTVTLREALRILRPGGSLVILDTPPLYRHASSGQAMVRERETSFSQRFGFASNALPSENYLTPARLQELAHTLDVRWTVTYPRHGWRFALRGWKRRLLGGRESARFPLILGRKDS
jgi:SAM-dependent methyltransferase